MTRSEELSRERRAGWAVGTAVGWIVIVAIIGGLAGWPRYKVYSQGKAGEARLREAESSRLIEIEEAKASKESAVYLAEAEKIRAAGVAEANAIISGSLGGPDGYLRYLWIQGLHDGTSELVYVPTEAGLPILEAGRRPRIVPAVPKED